MRLLKPRPSEWEFGISAVRPLAAAGAAFLLSVRPLWGCAACYGQSDSPMAAGMNWGIFSLLVVIVGVLGGVAAFFIYLARKSAAVASQADAAAGHASAKAGAYAHDGTGGFRRFPAVTERGHSCSQQAGIGVWLRTGISTLRFGHGREGHVGAGKGLAGRHRSRGLWGPARPSHRRHGA